MLSDCSGASNALRLSGRALTPTSLQPWLVRPWKYRARGSTRDGTDIFELVPLNQDFASIMVTPENPGRVIGPVVEHRRRLRRRNGA